MVVVVPAAGPRGGTGVRYAVNELIAVPASPRIPPATVIHFLAFNESELADATSDNDDPAMPMAVQMIVEVRLMQHCARIDLGLLGMQWS